MYDLYVEEAKTNSRKSLDAAKNLLIKRIFGKVTKLANSKIIQGIVEDVHEEGAQVIINYDKKNKKIYFEGHAIDLKEYL